MPGRDGDAWPGSLRRDRPGARRLGAFTPDGPELGLTAIAGRTGLPLTTVHRLVGELAAGGALDRGPDGRYRITPHRITVFRAARRS